MPPLLDTKHILIDEHIDANLSDLVETLLIQQNANNTIQLVAILARRLATAEEAIAYLTHRLTIAERRARRLADAVEDLRQHINRTEIASRSATQ